ncbi:MAG: hypothetical protein HOP19_19540, partial [Acidobacteria bacterium]|nr:hypothetical protein [Acidobacteriota bacterium]
HPAITTICTDLEMNALAFEPRSYDLIVKTCYLQRDLFAALKEAVRINGLFVAVIAMMDDDPQVQSMNPAFCLAPGELAHYFDDWELIHSQAGKSPDQPPRRALAEIIARRLR